jgi:N6-L-threonylcarbamoyladenine synthase
MNVLGIETSCDDTSLALYATDRGLIETVTASQLVHEDFGGIVPELASRQHLRTLLAVYENLLERTGMSAGDIDGIGVSNGPGLIGSLLVGVGFAKSLAWALGVPVVGVHHIEAHVLSNELGGEPLVYPCVVLVVSGGHTALFHIPRAGEYHRVGNTRDDAAGEAFDKIAKLLGLGFPGGPVVQKVAERGRDDAVDFPRAMRGRDNFDFSFSGLKTAVRLHVESLGTTPGGGLDEQTVADVAASAQAAIVDVLVEKTVACARRYGVGEVYVAGGVAANGPLRAALDDACAAAGITFHAPLLRFCTDNGAMVARTAAIHLESGRDDGHDLDVFARGALGD